MRRFSATTKPMPRSSYSRPTTLRLARSSTSTISPSGRPRRSTPVRRTDDAVAVQHLVHLARAEEDVGAAVLGNEEAEAVRMALDDAGDEVELGDDAELALAVDQQLAVALHRGEAAVERLAGAPVDGEVAARGRAAAAARPPAAAPRGSPRARAAAPGSMSPRRRGPPSRGSAGSRGADGDARGALPRGARSTGAAGVRAALAARRVERGSGASLTRSGAESKIMDCRCPDGGIGRRTRFRS